MDEHMKPLGNALQYARRAELANHFANLVQLRDFFYNLGGSHSHHEWLIREMSRTTKALEGECLILEKENEQASQEESERGSRRSTDGPAKAHGDQSGGGEPTRQDGEPGHKD